MLGIITYTLAVVSTTKDLATIVSAVNIAAVLLLGLYFYYNVFLHPLGKYPGPKARAASRIPYILGLASGRQHIIIKRLHDKYGSVVRIAPDKLSYTSGQAWRDIYGHKKFSEPEMSKDRRWFVADPNAQHIILSTRERHAHFRRLFSHGFSDRALREQEPLLRSYVDLLIQGLTTRANNGQTVVDLVEWYNWTTFDIIGDLTFGEPFGCLESGRLHPWVHGMFQAIKGITYLRVGQELPIIGPHMQTLLRKVAPAGALAKREEHLSFTRQKVTRRLNNTGDRPDFMDGILRQPPGNGLTFPELLSNSSVLVMAGSETTATLLSGATYLLLSNPGKMNKLVDEVTRAFHSSNDITIEATNRLVYLPAVIEESLRFYPPVAVGLPREVPAGGSHIDGKYVPAGTSVTVSHYAAYHSPTNFHQPDQFIPERFVDTAAFDDKQAVLQPFSMGPRNCIGRNLAYAETKLILARLVFHFDIRISEESMDWMNQNTYAIWEKQPLLVYLQPRPVQDSLEEDCVDEQTKVASK